jgi:hypothetical protein
VLERAAADSTALLGPDHSETVAIREDLANLLNPARFTLTEAISA